MLSPKHNWWVYDSPGQVTSMSVVSYIHFFGRAEYMYKLYIDDIFQFKNNYAYLRDQFFFSFFAAKKW